MVEYSDFYKTMAEGMDSSLSSINEDIDAIVVIMDSLDYLVDLTTDEDFDVNHMLLHIYPVMFNRVYNGLITIPYDKQKVYAGVFAINDYTKKYITPDLTDFVNNVVWPGNCVPYEWSIASEITGENISGWNVCDPS